MKTYRKVRELIESEGYTGTAALRKELGATGCVLPSRETVRRWALGKTSPLSGKNLFVARPSAELSFFLGIWIGDGWSDNNDGGKRLLLKVRSRTMAEEFAAASSNLLAKTKPYKVRINVDERGPWYIVKVTSFQLYDFVTQPLENLTEFIEPYLKAFLRGLYTAEGNPSVSLSQVRSHRLDVGICLSNSDLALLERCRDMLIKLDFNPGRLKVDRYKGEVTNLSVVTKTMRQFTISKFTDVIRFAETIGFADSAKQRKLTDAIELIGRFGSFQAYYRWTRLYEKRSGDWVRRNPSGATFAS